MILGVRNGPLSRNGHDIVDQKEEEREPRGTTRGDRLRHAVLTWVVLIQWVATIIVGITAFTAFVAVVFGFDTQHIGPTILGAGTVVAITGLLSLALKRNWWWAE
jgi:Ca2+/Na+ antiporter